MRTKLLPILLALSLTTASIPAKANFFGLTPSEESMFVSAIIVILPVAFSAKGVENVFDSLGKLSESNTPLVITKIEPVPDSKQMDISADLNGETIKFRAQAKSLERADVRVGTNVYARKTKAGFVLEHNETVVGLVTDNQNLLKQERVQ